MSGIVWINMASGFGGGEYQTAQLMQEISQTNSRGEGGRLYFFGKKQGKLADYVREKLPEIQVIGFFKLLFLLLVKKISLIHAQDGRGAQLGGLLKTLFAAKLIITRHVDFPLKRRSSQKAYRIADCIVGVSRAISEKLSVLNEQTQTIYGAVRSIEYNDDLIKKYGLNQKHEYALRIVQIGNFQAVKNFPLTIELAKQNPDKLFYLLGSGAMENELKAQAADCKNVIFIPFTPYIGSVLKHCDLMILPSHSEGLPGVILEAYACKIPVLANRVGGIVEIVEHGKTGFLIENNDIKQYQQYLNQLSTSPQLLLQMQLNAAHFVQEKDFSAKRMANEYRVLYRQLLQNQTA